MSPEQTSKLSQAAALLRDCAGVLNVLWPTLIEPERSRIASLISRVAVLRDEAARLTVLLSGPNPRAQH